MRRVHLWAVAAIAALALIAPGTANTSTTGFVRPTPQAFAEHLLATRAGQIMTPMARAAISMIASGQPRFGVQTTVPEATRPATASQAPLGPAAFTNTRVNDPSLDTNQIDQTTQSETTVAVVGPNVAVGYNDSQQGLLFLTAAANLSGYSYSRNGGATWTDGGTIPNGSGMNNVGDPWLTSDPEGNMYYSQLTIDIERFNLAVTVAKSTDGGKTWGVPVVASPPKAFGYFGDKPVIVAGPDPADPSQTNLYDSWDDFFCNRKSCFTGLPVSRSTDGGHTWQLSYADLAELSFEGCSFSQWIGAQPLVKEDGTLLVAAEQFSVDDPKCNGGTFTVRELLYTSTDGGVSFGPPVTIADVTPIRFLEFNHGEIMRTIEFPSMALLGDTLYVAWNDGRLSPRSHIILAKSSDMVHFNLSFVTQGTGDEVQPALNSDSSGLHLLYYGRKGKSFNVFIANSADGKTWATKRVTTVSSPGVVTVPNFDPIVAWGYMGDYIANVSDGSHLYFAWGDNRDIVTNGLWPHGRYDPDVFFAKQ
jgi:hypothetical protein